MTFEFQVPADGDGGSSITTQLQCTKSGGEIHCHLSDSRGIETVIVTSGGETLRELDEPPFHFDLTEAELQTVNGDKQFTVELRDAAGRTLRRFVRRADLIPG